MSSPRGRRLSGCRGAPFLEQNLQRGIFRHDAACEQHSGCKKRKQDEGSHRAEQNAFAKRFIHSAGVPPIY